MHKPGYVILAEKYRTANKRYSDAKASNDRKAMHYWKRQQRILKIRLHKRLGRMILIMRAFKDKLQKKSLI